MKHDYCVVCGKVDQLHHHPLIPSWVDGSDDETKLITLCSRCLKALAASPKGFLVTQQSAQGTKPVQRAPEATMRGYKVFGYRVVGHGNEARLEQIPDEQKAIGRMHDLRKRGWSYQDIAVDLAKKGFNVSYMTVRRTLEKGDPSKG